jgi:hypothetical protein
MAAISRLSVWRWEQFPYQSFEGGNSVISMRDWNYDNDQCPLPRRYVRYWTARKMQSKFGGAGGLEVEALDQQAEDVLEGEMGLLNVHGDRGRNDDVVIADLAHLAAAVAGEPDGSDAGFAGLFESVEDVRRVAGGGDAQEDIAGLAERFDLAREDLVEAEVVGAGGENGGVGGEGDGAQGGAVVGEADDELGDEMLGVRGGASVAGDEELAAGLHGAGGEFGDGDEGVGDCFVGKNGLHGGDGLSELLLD